MNKKIIIASGVIFIVLLIGICFFISGLIKLNKSVTSLSDGLTLIREGKYEEGLSKCNEMYYRSGTCYVIIIGLKLSRNESFTKDFCDRIPSSENEPFWISWMIDNRKSYLANVNYARNSCYSNSLR